ncbi:MAG: hypothetical protein LBU17_04565 [Treponema sp.]|jgi:hypothetical protein|nr:hypothetical protein [Treponema sp.]
MTRGILIAGNESALFAAIRAETAKRVERFATAVIPNRVFDPGQDKTTEPREAQIPLLWNPGSPVSARTLILAAENRLEHINEAILVCVPPSVHKRPGELASADIETMINDHIKGWFFLVKELTAVFKMRKTGTLALVCSEIDAGGGKGDAPDLLGPSVLASFRAFAQGLLAASQDEPFQIMGFSGSAGDTTAFAAFIFKVMEEGGKRNSGKMHRFGKLSFFGR